MTATRALHTTIRDGAGDSAMDDANNALRVNVVAGGAGGGSVDGDVAHDSADSGDPVKVGGQARTTNPTAVADADRVNAIFDDVGRQVVILGHVRDLVTDAHTEITNTTETTVLAAGGAGVFHDITQLVITNQSATATVATLRESTGGTTRAKFALAANGGAVIPFAVPLKGAANSAWTLQLSATATVDVLVQAVKNV